MPIWRQRAGPSQRASRAGFGQLGAQEPSFRGVLRLEVLAGRIIASLTMEVPVAEARHPAAVEHVTLVPVLALVALITLREAHQGSPKMVRKWADT